ncbi:MAG: hypothetical protein GHCLOJNM_01448 [bacterium]|nr:hypothetical protein [bacterium]
MFGRIAVFAYGVVSYCLALATFAYLAGFMGGFLVPTWLDAPREGSLGAALLMDILLIGVFGLQHSVMARPGFKAWWTRYVHRAAERSTYLVFSCLAMALMFWQWRPIGGVVWEVESASLRGLVYGIYGCGWVIVLVSTFLINHFDLFGLRQVWLHLQGKEWTHLRFVTPGPYKRVRHPLYIGWMVTFWAAPTMTVAHFVFAALMTSYILVAIRYEERDLAAFHGEDYRRYRERVPMLIPRLFGHAQELPSARNGAA